MWRSCHALGATGSMSYLAMSGSSVLRSGGPGGSAFISSSCCRMPTPGICQIKARHGSVLTFCIAWTVRLGMKQNDPAAAVAFRSPT